MTNAIGYRTPNRASRDTRFYSIRFKEASGSYYELTLHEAFEELWQICDIDVNSKIQKIKDIITQTLLEMIG